MEAEGWVALILGIIVLIIVTLVSIVTLEWLDVHLAGLLIGLTFYLLRADSGLEFPEVHFLGDGFALDAQSPPTFSTNRKDLCWVTAACVALMHVLAVIARSTVDGLPDGIFLAMGLNSEGLVPITLFFLALSVIPSALLAGWGAPRACHVLFYLIRYQKTAAIREPFKKCNALWQSAASELHTAATLVDPALHPDLANELRPCALRLEMECLLDCLNSRDWASFTQLVESIRAFIQQVVDEAVSRPQEDPDDYQDDTYEDASTQDFTTSELDEALKLLRLNPDLNQLTEAALKKAYRRLATTCHPDKGGSAEAMQNLNNARDLLSDYLEAV